MGKINLLETTKSFKNVLKKHSPEILTGLGIAGMISTTILAVKATPKALDLIQSDSRMNHDGNPRAYTTKEAIKSCWRCYVPTVVTGTASIVCLIGASSVNHSRNAALATVYTISETALKEYKDKVIEVVGDKKEEAIHDAVAKEKIKNNPVSTKEVFITGNGNTLCYDILSDRYFRSNRDKLIQAMNELNRNMLSEMSISLNEFYIEIGLPEIPLARDIGWDVDHDYIDLRFSSQLADDGTPCLVLDHDNMPRPIVY